MGSRGNRKQLIGGSIAGIPAECYGHLVGRGGEFARFMTAGEDSLTSYHVDQQKRKRDGDITIRMKAQTHEIMDKARTYLLSHIDSYFDRRD
jgi:hypothetical protein